MDSHRAACVRDEDGEIVGEVWYLPMSQRWRAWALYPEAGQTKLSRHETKHAAENEIRRFWGMAQRMEMTDKQAEIQERIHNPGRIRHEPPILIHKRDDLAFFASEVGARLDWHEPDEQDLTAMMYGTSFDNAGFWGEPTYEYYTNEMHVVLYVKHYPVVAVNLATLFGWATEDKRGWRKSA